MTPVRLAVSALAVSVLGKVWGSQHTEPWFTNTTGQKIGEVWYRASDGFPLLAKILFTSDDLSIQVHPDDAAAAPFNSRGKTEMWHVLRAEPGARVALGLRHPVSPEHFRQACESGAVIDLLNWFPVAEGDTFFTPAGTVHAIGGGLTICEIQQHSDITYRLYDFGRPDRELHLDQGVRVSHLTAHPGKQPPVPLSESRQLLVECSHFRTERLEVSGTVTCPSPAKGTLYIALAGEGTLADQPFRQGEAFEVNAGAPPFEIRTTAAVFLITAEPATSEPS